MNTLFLILPAVLVSVYGALLATRIHLAFHSSDYVEKWALRISWFSLVIYFVWLLLLTIYQQQIPFVTKGQLAALIGFLIWAAHFSAQRRVKQGVLALLPTIAVIFLVLLSLIFGAYPIKVPEKLESMWVSLHITFEMAGVAFLLGVGIYSIGYLVLFRQIKKRRFGTLYSMMPSLNDLDRLRSLALNWGWIFVTCGTFLGALWMLLQNDLYVAFSGHLRLSIIFWFIVTIMAGINRFSRQKPHQLASWSVFVFACLTILIILSVSITYHEASL